MDVFISYSSADDNKRLAFSRALRKADPPLTPLVVAARREPGRLLSDKVMECIQEADILVPVLTRSSIASQWVNQEIGYAQGIERKVVPLVEHGIIHDLRGFVHAQGDLPFAFQGSPSDARREAASFRRAFGLLIDYLEGQQSDRTLQSKLFPKQVRRGGSYTTTVSFKGTVVNGFFDNYVEHLGSAFATFNWDSGTIPAGPDGIPPNDVPGLLNGAVDVERSYAWRTTGWPVGPYRISVRLYSHPIPGQDVRTVVAENVHEFEVVS